jgi:hypothetical protein
VATNANRLQGRETDPSPPRQHVLNRKRTSILNPEYRVGKIPTFDFLALNSISLRYFPAHPKSGRNTRFIRILARSSTCNSLTNYHFNRTFGEFLTEILGVILRMQKSKKWPKNRSNDSFRPKTIKNGQKATFRPIYCQPINPPKTPFSPTFQAFKAADHDFGPAPPSHFFDMKSPLVDGLEGPWNRNFLVQNLCIFQKTLLFTLLFPPPKPDSWHQKT